MINEPNNYGKRTMSSANNAIIANDSRAKVSILSWECPVCGVGVRGDVDVCPNCLDRENQSAEKRVSKNLPIPVFRDGGLTFIEESDSDETE